MSLKSKKLFVDGRTDGRTDIWDLLMLLRRLRGVDLKPISSEETVREKVREGSPGGRSKTTGDMICETNR